MSKASREVHELLLAASSEVTPATDDVEAWDYGWHVDTYRRSPGARLSGPSGTFRMSPKGVEKYEAAVELLLAEQPIRYRWHPDEFWSIVASLVVFLSLKGTSSDVAAAQVERLRKAAPSLVLAPAANILWEGPPAVLAGVAVFGDWDDPQFAAAASGLRETTGDGQQDITNYIADQRHHRPVTGFATVVASQHSLAFDRAAKRLEELCDTSLLLVRNKEKYGLYSLRGTWNRPGIRGLTLDRPATESIMSSSEHSVELASQPLILDELGKSSAVH